MTVQSRPFEPSEPYKFGVIWQFKAMSTESMAHWVVPVRLQTRTRDYKTSFSFLVVLSRQKLLTKVERWQTH